MENRSSSVVFRAVFAIACIAWLPVFAAEDLSAWANVTELSLNTSAGGAGIPSTLIGFPLLVRLTAANFEFAQARPDGRDIRFAKPDGTPLPYEIERWDASSRAAEVWVRLDTLRGNDAAQSIRMYWGNASAPDQTLPGAVFGAANGYVSAWHLGGSGSDPRPNAAGGNPATPVRYTGKEATAGVIAGADSLDGSADGDYLDVGPGYDGLGAGMTFTVWAYPTAANQWSHMLDLGNGENSDNIVVGRWDTTSGLAFHNWSGANHGSVNAPGQLVLNQWHMLGVTVTGKSVKLYKDGVQVLSDTVAFPITGVVRNLCFLGRSNSARSRYYQGKLDEPEISAATRSPDWIKLLYQNQKPGQAIPIVKKTAACVFGFSVQADTGAPEGSMITLRAQAGCASSFAWSLVSGPSLRILDPEKLSLPVGLPRVAGDTSLVFRFTAVYSDSTRTGDVRVRVREAIPDPVFTMPRDSVWNGLDPLSYRPNLVNLAALRAAPDSALHWLWAFSGPAVDTTGLPDGIVLKHAEAGNLVLRLCLDNGGAPVCHEATLKVVAPGATGLIAPKPLPAAAPRALRDALGRAAFDGAGRLRNFFRP
jgi:hypothetical protein